MIVDERMVTYIHSLETPEEPIIEQIEQEAKETFVPIIRKETQSFLKVLLLMKKPVRVLEVGTAIGYSAILMSHYLPKDGRITTIEKYEKGSPLPGRILAGPLWRTGSRCWKGMRWRS